MPPSAAGLALGEEPQIPGHTGYSRSSRTGPVSSSYPDKGNPVTPLSLCLAWRNTGGVGVTEGRSLHSAPGHPCLSAAGTQFRQKETQSSSRWTAGDFKGCWGKAGLRATLSLPVIFTGPASPLQDSLRGQGLAPRVLLPPEDCPWKPQQHLGPKQGPRPRLLKPLIPQGYYQRPKRLRVARVQPSQAARSAASHPIPSRPRAPRVPRPRPAGHGELHKATQPQHGQLHVSTLSQNPARHQAAGGGRPPYPHTPSPQSFGCPLAGQPSDRGPHLGARETPLDK